MLRIEIYPIMSGLAVRANTCYSNGLPKQAGDGAMAVTRVIPSETIETVGITEALRDQLLDLVVLYPGLFEKAID